MRKALRIIPSVMLCAVCVAGTAGCAQTPADQQEDSSEPPTVQTDENAQDQTPEEEAWYDELPLPSWSQYKQLDVSDANNWFKTYELPGNVFAIYDDNQWEENICYLVIGSDKALLIDTSMGISSIKDVAEKLTDLPITVLLTHTHHDHMGGMHEFEDVWCFDSEQAIERCTTGTDEFGDISYELEDDALRRPLPEGVSAETFQIIGTTPTHTVKDGDVIDLGDRELKVYATPGHTGDSICLIDEQNHLLFTGDTYYPDDLYAFSEDADLATYMQSMYHLADLVEEYSIEYIYPGHIEIVTDTSVIKNAADSMKQILDGEATEYELTEDGRCYSFDNGTVIITADEDV